MTVLCIGYYDKFSRFFLALKKELQKTHSNISFTYFSIHISGCLYLWARFISSKWIPFICWLKVRKHKSEYYSIIKNSNTYKGVNFKNLIKFHLALNKNANKTHLLLQTLAYIDLIDDYFIVNKPNYVLLIGDSRLAIETTITIAKNHKTPCFFIEQGPFNTTIFDVKGVNANASIRTLSATNSFKTVKLNTNNSKHYNRFPIYRAIDYVLEYLLENTKFYPPDLKHFKLFNGKNDAKIKRTTNFKKTEKPVFALILQVPFDVNMIYHSTHYKNHLDIVKSVSNNIPENSTLIVREHPIYKGKYSKELYTFIKHNNIFLDGNKSCNTLLKRANVVVVNNSTIGIEAIAQHKTVVVLGNAYYDSSNICLKLKNKAHLKDLLKASLNFKPNHQDITNFLNQFINNTAIKGGIIDKDLQCVKQIANKLNSM